MKFFFPLIILIFIYKYSISQPELTFERYTTSNGLPHNDIHCITQDKYGFIWFGTSNGVTRFDGINFKDFNSFTRSIGCVKNGRTFSMKKDLNENIWIGCDNGIYKFDYEIESFIHQRLEDGEIVMDIFKNYKAFSFNSNNSILLYGNKLILFDPNTKNLTEIPCVNSKHKDNLKIKSLIEDRYSNIWIGTFGDGLYRYSNDSKKITYFRHNPKNKNSISTNFIEKIYEDSKGNIWIGTLHGGLNLFASSQNKRHSEDLGNSAFQKFQYDSTNINSLSHNTVYVISEDSKNKLWIGTVNGLCLLDKDKMNFHRYYYDDRNPESLNDNTIKDIYCDKAGNLWIGTRLGVARLKNQRFKTYSYSSYKNSISHNKVQYLFYDNKEYIFVCTSIGIDIFNLGTKQFNSFDIFNKTKPHLSAGVLCMVEEAENNYLIGTKGLVHFDRNREKCSTLQIYKSPSDMSKIVMSLCKGSTNHIWIGTWGNGILRYNTETKQFTHANTRDFISVIYKGNDQTIWAGTLHGLFYVSDKGKDLFKFEQYKIKDIDKSYDELSLITCLYQDKNSLFWIGTRNGLIKHNLKTKAIKYYTVKNGLPSNYITSIIEDYNHTLWITTNLGLASLNPYQDGSGPARFKVYKEEYGLQTEYMERSSCITQDGEIFLGGSKGFTTFYPKDIVEDTVLPRLVLTDFTINNKSIGIKDTINGQVILDESITRTAQLNLNYKNNSFAIQFAALQFNNPINNKYKYRLKGFQDDWNMAGSKNQRAVYTNINEGEYIFQLKASNNDGFWTKHPLELKITIEPPWWRLLWFRILLLGSIVIATVALFRFKTYQIRKQKKSLEIKVNERTKQLIEMNAMLAERQEELELQANELKLANSTLEDKTDEIEQMAKKMHESDQKQLRFYANISHEFRTPLTLIIAPLEQFIKQKSPIRWDEIQKKHLLMHRNAKRLFRLINQILDFRKIDQKSIELNYSHNNILKFIEEICELFSVQADAKGIQIIVKSEEFGVKSEEQQTQRSKLITHFWFDPDIMEKILYNLISNAIKYTPEGGVILIEIGVVETQCIASLQNQLSIKISDTGIGIKPEHIDKIFDRFYRVETHSRVSLQNGRTSLPENQNKGTGIGLAYTKELIEQHNGNISVESRFGEGAIFTLTFPIDPEISKNSMKSTVDTVPLQYIRSMIEHIEKSEFTPQDKLTNQHPDILKLEKNKLTLLIAEDNYDMQAFLKNELQNEYNIIQKFDGNSGYKAAIEILPDFIISDIMMPGIDGVELCRRIKNNENTSHIPVILLTAVSSEVDTIVGLDSGADDYITKPFNIDIVKARISNILINRRRISDKFSSGNSLNIDDITTTSIDKRFIENAIDIVEKNMHDPSFSIDKFVSSCNMSKPTLYKKIKSLTNLSVSDFIRTIRLRRAAELLLQKDKSVTITEIAYMIGFKNKQTFSRDFKNMYGKTPTQFLNGSI